MDKVQNSSHYTQSLETIRLRVNFKPIYKSGSTIIRPLNTTELSVLFVGGDFIISTEERKSAHGLSLWRS
jgi:hypothetical protein